MCVSVCLGGGGGVKGCGRGGYRILYGCPNLTIHLLENEPILACHHYDKLVY